MDNLLVDTAATLEVTFYADGTPVDVDGNTVAVTIRDSFDQEVVASGSATHGTTGVYTFDLPAQSQLRHLRARWDATISGKNVDLTTYHAIVGGFYFSIAELKAMNGLSAFSYDTLYGVRAVVEDLFDDYCERPFVKRYCVESHDGNDRGYLYLDRLPARDLISVTIDGTAVTTTDWTLSRTGRLDTSQTAIFPRAAKRQNVTVEYTYGEDEPPGDLKHAALRYARHVALTGDTGIPDRARMMTTEFATFHLTIATEENPTGLPEVDAVLRRYRNELPAFA